MKNRQFATSLSCRHCSAIGKRIFDGDFSSEGGSASGGKKEDLLEYPSSYIVLMWIACATEKCRNFFSKLHSLSRCPVCHRWSVKLTMKNKVQNWICLNHECEWRISLKNNK